MTKNVDEGSDFCPKCNSENIYEDRMLWICPDCSHEWVFKGNESKNDDDLSSTSEDYIIKDANGHILVNGDSIIVAKDLPIKGTSITVKSGTKVRNIRLKDTDDGHNISCKIDGIGSINLKSEFVKKV